MTNALKSMRKIACGAIAALALLTVPAVAEEPQPGRFQMTEVENGMLRLDTQTGAVSFCSLADDQWDCKMADDDRAALAASVEELERENVRLSESIDRLRDETKKLRARISELQATQGNEDSPTLSLPSDAEMDRVIGFMERLMRRFYAFAQSLRGQPAEEI